MHETGDYFHSIITVSYTKYFVHSYTVDVVFTLSYMVVCASLADGMGIMISSPLTLSCELFENVEHEAVAVIQHWCYSGIH